MGNYRQHLTFAWLLGVAYAAAGAAWARVSVVYGSVAMLLSTLSGLLPDLDSDSGVEMRGFTGMLGVLVAVAVWHRLAVLDAEPAFEYHLWATVIAYVAVRHGARRVASRLMKHRGISHSLPTCGVWGAVTYLYYPSTDHRLKVMMAGAVMLGFFSHLFLDEVCSVDLRGARVNKAFGTAIKLWAPSPWTTLGMYALLSYLSYRVIDEWPRVAKPFGEPVVAPKLPFRVKDVVRSIEEKVPAATGPMPRAAPPADPPPSVAGPGDGSTRVRREPVIRRNWRGEPR